MNVLYVHGFGGGRGLLSRALADCARGGPHYLRPVFWPSGDLRELRARAVVDVARRVAETRSLPRGLVQAAVRGSREASQAWEQAVANVPAGAAQLAIALEAAHSTGKPTSILGFSLGCRVVLHAISAGVLAPGSVQRVVFAASAAPASAFDVVEPILGAGTRVTHVFSRRDAVLERLYPLGDRLARPSGLAKLEFDGIDNVEVDVGHRGYSSVAPVLWDLLTGEEARKGLPRLRR